MKKQIMSIAAIAAIFTTGASAFDVYHNGTDANISTDRSGKGITNSSYNIGVTAADPITLSNTRKGDALIYPAYSQDGGYATEIVVRNTSNRAIVAKAVMYSGIDSEELLDFNIYLSPKDVCRFTIKDGKITSNDGSIRTNGIYPNDVKANGQTIAKNDYTSIQFANKKEFSHTIDTAKFKKGYIAIFGMVQADVEGQFHKQHADLYAAYAQTLDNTRANWRDLKNPAVLLGSLFIDKVKVAPSIESPKLTIWKKYRKVGSNPATLTSDTVTFQDVSDTALSGEVRLFDTKGHDMILPATAIKNFSEATRVSLWTEGEYASIADRCIDTNGYTYNKDCLDRDAKVFDTKTAIYTYANREGQDTSFNQVLITQPYKRTFLQLGDTTGYKGKANKTKKTVETGAGYYFTTKADVYNEDETKSETVYTTGIILSGIDNEAVKVNEYSQELQMIQPDAFEKSDENKEKFGAGNGFAEFSVRVPSIITQMVASKSGESTETNWIYSEKN